MLGLLIVAALAGEPLFKPTGKYAPVITEPANPSAKTEQSDLHSHLCSNPRCKHEWWHDPRKGPVSHNCPKCGREQYVINRHAPADSRAMPTNDVSSPPRPVVRESVSKSIVYVVGSTTCGACQVFERNHGKGDATTEYRYVKLDRPRPADIDVATWNQCVNFSNSGRFLWPFFVAKIEGQFIAVQARVEK